MITKASVASFDGLFRSSEYSIHIAGIRIRQLIPKNTPVNGMNANASTTDDTCQWTNIRANRKPSSADATLVVGAIETRQTFKNRRSSAAKQPRVARKCKADSQPDDSGNSVPVCPEKAGALFRHYEALGNEARVGRGQRPGAHYSRRLAATRLLWRCDRGGQGPMDASARTSGFLN
jgi:hypothetical protein